MEMARLRVPICCVVIGEGGSGGALGIGVGDRLAMFEHAYYSVITPEGCAAILWKSAAQAADAAAALKLTSRELKKLNLVDDVLTEPLGGGHRDPSQMIETFEQYVVGTIRDLKRVRLDTLLRRRYERLRTLGSFFESASGQVAAPSAKSSGKSRRNGTNGRSQSTTGRGSGASRRAGGTESKKLAG
jgi:acetyl-CoA carboxylase carboxyl transferase subunit alpha